MTQNEQTPGVGTPGAYKNISDKTANKNYKRKAAKVKLGTQALTHEYGTP